MRRRNRIHVLDVEEKTGLTLPAEFDRRYNDGKLYLSFKSRLIEFVGGDPDIAAESIIEEATFLKVRCNALHSKIVAGEMTDMESRQFSNWTNTLSRLMLRLKDIARANQAIKEGKPTSWQDIAGELFPNPADDDEDAEGEAA